MRFIDLFAGLGGIRLGFEKSFQASGFSTECVFTSEIKSYAVDALQRNFSHDKVHGDITKVPSEDIPDFDFMLAGFPCQAFSSGGKRHGFSDTRGTLFFEIERILRDKKPSGFILENVEGLVRHDLESPSDLTGRTFNTIFKTLTEDLGYKVSWKVFDSLDFGLPQSRKRIFIVGHKEDAPDIQHTDKSRVSLEDILEKGLETMETPFVKQLLSKYEFKELYGQSIKDKRGGKNNIHSWDIEIKGEVSPEQKTLLGKLLRERRKKHWAEEIGIKWMDGMPLTAKQISTFHGDDIFGSVNLQEMLEDLCEKGYLRYEYPKKLVVTEKERGQIKERVYDETKPKGYNIVTGKLSFEINKVLDPADIAPTIVATDVTRLAVPDGGGLRRLTVREGLRLFGYPETYTLSGKYQQSFDLLGNTVAVPVVTHVAHALASTHSAYLGTVSTQLVCTA